MIARKEEIKEIIVYNSSRIYVITNKHEYWIRPDPEDTCIRLEKIK